jgi:hypothetical protein
LTLGLHDVFHRVYLGVCPRAQFSLRK